MCFRFLEIVVVTVMMLMMWHRATGVTFGCFFKLQLGANILCNVLCRETRASVPPYFRTLGEVDGGRLLACARVFVRPECAA